jgi:hypothetical protein
MIISSFYVALSADDVFRLVSYMFDKSPSSEQPNSVHAPFYSENPPHEVGIFVFLDHIFFCYL